jgi:pyrroloquinoline quinone biosynthesis protein E
MLAELTHRCPLRCAFCSNPLALEPKEAELGTAIWLSVLRQAVALGVMQVHFSGGEPTVRRDLEILVGEAAGMGLYTNLITSGVLMTREMAARLAGAGLEHVQLGLPDIDEDGALAVTAYKGGVDKKLRAAEHIQAAGLALTVNAVITRHNAARVGAMIDTAVALGARRIEIANVQYYGWALKNRAALIPTPDQLKVMSATVKEARDRLKGRLVIDYVIPDYYARKPKSCMGGWGRQFFNVTPSGTVLPCHAAETIPHLAFQSVLDMPLREIWEDGPAFQAYRGDAWMPKGCRSCDRKEQDWGGCRCQALALAGDAGAMDPTCDISPHHDRVRAVAEEESRADASLGSVEWRSFTFDK